MTFDNTTLGLLMFYIAGGIALLVMVLFYLASKKR